MDHPFQPVNYQGCVFFQLFQSLIEPANHPGIMNLHIFFVQECHYFCEGSRNSGQAKWQSLELEVEAQDADAEKMLMLFPDRDMKIHLCQI